MFSVFQSLIDDYNDVVTASPFAARIDEYVASLGPTSQFALAMRDAFAPIETMAYPDQNEGITGSKRTIKELHGSCGCAFPDGKVARRNRVISTVRPSAPTRFGRYPLSTYPL